MIRIGVIGCGQWGPNHIRNFIQSGRARVIRCADKNPGRLKEMERLFPGIETTRDSMGLAAADDVDCVIVATPLSSHYDLAAAALRSGKDVLCEKPMCSKVEECLHLIELAERHQRILMVGHVFLFNAGIRALKQRLQAGAVGEVRYMHATRTNLGPVRQDVGAAMDLAGHDISIFDYLLDALPESVSARGGCWLNDGVEDVAFISFRYPNQVLANAHTSWLDPHKVRRLTVVGDAGMAQWDDIDATAPLTLFDKTVERDLEYESFGEFRLLAHEGDVVIPRVHLGEPLRDQTAHFLGCVERRERPLTDGRNGLEVVSVLQAVERSMERDGAPVAVEIPD